MPDPNHTTASTAATSARPDLALLYTDTNFISDLLDRPLIASAFQPIDVYDLEHTDLGPYLGLVVPGLTDREHLLRHADRIRAFLDAGRVVVYSGMLFRPWLLGAEVVPG